MTTKDESMLELLRMIDHKVDDLRTQARADLQEVKLSVDRVTTKVTEQNGRVGKLELWKHGLETVQATHTWRFPAVLGIASAVIIVAITQVIEHLLGV